MGVQRAGGNYIVDGKAVEVKVAVPRGSAELNPPPSIIKGGIGGIGVGGGGVSGISSRVPSITPIGLYPPPSTAQLQQQQGMMSHQLYAPSGDQSGGHLGSLLGGSHHAALHGVPAFDERDREFEMPDHLLNMQQQHNNINGNNRNNVNHHHYNNNDNNNNNGNIGNNSNNAMGQLQAAAYNNMERGGFGQLGTSIYGTGDSSLGQGDSGSLDMSSLLLSAVGSSGNDDYYSSHHQTSSQSDFSGGVSMIERMGAPDNEDNKERWEGYIDKSPDSEGWGSSAEVDLSNIIRLPTAPGALEPQEVLHAADEGGEEGEALENRSRIAIVLLNAAREGVEEVEEGGVEEEGEVMEVDEGEVMEVDAVEENVENTSRNGRKRKAPVLMNL